MGNLWHSPSTLWTKPPTILPSPTPPMPSSSDFLDHIRRSMGSPPRSLGWFKPSPFAIPEPAWMVRANASDEPLKEFIRGQKSLWKHGVVVWGHVVRANRKLYEDGKDDCPGTFIFSATATDDEAIAELPRLVKCLHDLMNHDAPAPGWTQRELEWWEDLQNDMACHRGFRLPESWMTKCTDYKGSLLLLHRPHLPDGKILSRLLPLLVDPVSCIAQVVPVEIWPDGLAAWLANRCGFPETSSEAQSAIGDSLRFLADTIGDRTEREEAYRSVFGPIESVYHELIISPHHIDVYHFRWEPPRDEHGYVTGGMSDALQPGGGDFSRVELVLYTKEHREHYLKFLQSFARYPWQTGHPILPLDTIPLGDHAASMLGSDRFTNLTFLPGVSKAESAIHESPTLAATQTRLMTVVPLTDSEFQFKNSHPSQAFLDLLRERRFDLAFSPERPALV